MFKEEEISEADGSLPNIEDGDGVEEKNTEGTKRAKGPKKTKLKGQQSSEIPPPQDVTTPYQWRIT